MSIILFCKECDEEIIDPVRKNQKFGAEICSKRFHTRAYKRRKFGIQPENYRVGIL